MVDIMVEAVQKGGVFMWGRKLYKFERERNAM